MTILVFPCVRLRRWSGDEIKNTFGEPAAVDAPVYHERYSLSEAKTMTVYIVVFEWYDIPVIIGVESDLSRAVNLANETAAAAKSDERYQTSCIVYEYQIGERTSSEDKEPVYVAKTPDAKPLPVPQTESFEEWRKHKGSFLYIPGENE